MTLPKYDLFTEFDYFATYGHAASDVGSRVLLTWNPNNAKRIASSIIVMSKHTIYSRHITAKE